LVCYRESLCFTPIACSAESYLQQSTTFDQILSAEKQNKPKVWKKWNTQFFFNFQFLSFFLKKGNLSLLSLSLHIFLYIYLYFSINTILKIYTRELEKRGRNALYTSHTCIVFFASHSLLLLFSFVFYRNHFVP